MSARKVQAAAAAKSAGAGGMSVEEKCLTMMRPGELFSMDEDMVRVHACNTGVEKNLCAKRVTSLRPHTPGHHTRRHLTLLSPCSSHCSGWPRGIVHVLMQFTSLQRVVLRPYRTRTVSIPQELVWESDCAVQFDPVQCLPPRPTPQHTLLPSDRFLLRSLAVLSCCIRVRSPCLVCWVPRSGCWREPTAHSWGTHKLRRRPSFS